MKVSGVLLPKLSESAYMYPRVAMGKLEPSSEPGVAQAEITFTIGPGASNQDIFNFLLEETLANTVSRIAIGPEHPLFPAATAMDKSEKKRWIVEIKNDPPLELRALMQPIEEEFNVEISATTIGGPSETMDALPDGLQNDLMTVHSSLDSFLTATKHELQADIPLEQTIHSLANVRRAIRNPKTGRNLAAFEGMFKTYTPCEAEGLRFVSTADEDQVARIRELFEDRLLDDPTYLEYSACGHSIGIVRQARKAIMELKRLTKKMLQHPVFGVIYEPFRHVFKVPAPGVEVALPAQAELLALFKSEYRPPIAPFRAALPSLEGWIQRGLQREARRQGLPASSVEGIFKKP